MKLRITAIILLALCFCFVGSNAAFAKSRHHAKGVATSQKIGHRAHHKAKHKGIAKHSTHKHIGSSGHSKIA